MVGEVAALKRDNPVALLEQKFLGWVVQQPEWLAIVAMPRQQRRAAMKELANRLYTIPVMDGANTIPRVVRRKVSKQLAAAAKQNEMTFQIREALATALAQEAEEKELAEALAAAENEGMLAPELASEPLEGPEEQWTSPDPEGDVKAQIEEAKEAEAAKLDEVVAEGD